MQALIVSFDSLATNSLGCYGNEWVETPHWDRLAASGAVFDRHFLETTGPLSGMAWSDGGRATASATSFRLGDLLKFGKMQSRLIASGPLLNWQQEIPFDKVQSVQGIDGIDAKPDETPFAKVVIEGISVWNDPSFQKTPRLMWLHSAGPGIPPAGFDSLYFEDFEDRGQQMSLLSDEEKSQHPSVYAGSVSLIDHWLGTLLHGVEASFADTPTIVLVMAAKGFLWQQIKPSKSNESRCQSVALGDQIAKTPLVLKTYGDVRFEDLVCLRSDRLVQTGDLVPTLVDWFRLKDHHGHPVPRSWLRELTEESPLRSYLAYDDGHTIRAVRTQEWLLIQETLQSHGVDDVTPTSRVSLYVKPEDLWDVNNVASQQPEIVADLVGKISISDGSP